ncbi:MAG TPA: hypothetical protein VF816_11940 [Rhodocyclaceae bacterium]
MSLNGGALGVFAIAGSLILGACATTPTPLGEATVTPAERVFHRPPVGKPTGTAVFIRDRGMAGSAVYQNLSIDGERAAAIDVGEKATIQVTAGEHVFSIIPTDPFGTHAEFSIDQNIEAGRTYYYRVLTDGNTLSTRIQRIVGRSLE